MLLVFVILFNIFVMQSWFLFDFAFYLLLLNHFQKYNIFGVI